MTPAAGLSITEHLPDGPATTAPVVVLVHGSLDRSGSFARVVRRLDDLHTVSYDRRGYHRSRHVVPVHETLEGHVDDLLQVIDGRPSVVVGHSYGGAITLAAASRPAIAVSRRVVDAPSEEIANQPATPVYGPCRLITVVGSNAAHASAFPPNSRAMVCALFPAFGK